MITGPDAARAGVLQRLREDLIGPLAPDETLTERPSDRYLTGILYPAGEAVSPSEDDTQREESKGSELDGDASEVPVYRATRPATFGLSFRLTGKKPSVRILLRGGRYEAAVAGHPTPAPEPTVPSPEAAAADTDRVSEGDAERPNGETARRVPRQYAWTRRVVEASVDTRIAPGFVKFDLPGATPLELKCAIRAVALADDAWGVTVVVSNEASAMREPIAVEEGALFQAALRVEPLTGTQLAPRRLTSPRVSDDDDRSSGLLYRNVLEWAVGHCSGATWEDRDGQCTAVETTWSPEAHVLSVSPLGAGALAAWSESTDGSAAWLADATDGEVIDAACRLADSYAAWVDATGSRVRELRESLHGTADEHVTRARRALERIREGIELLERDAKALRAFRLANEAMLRQRRAQGHDPSADLRWRPFQLAFQLLCLPSTARRSHPDRAVMDLLWFPTGGGKTEAYLGLIAFTLFYRRLRNDSRARGAGVAAIMRYTLRVLTTQQFQRAASVVAACEVIRLREADLGALPFSVGLWIGSDAIPNKVEDARRNPATVKVLTECPACGGRLTNPTRDELTPRCRTEDCTFATRPIPVHVIDEEIYAARPSLVIATIDKFAQITREPRTADLFALDGQHDRPDLILQDELHLISGPLGTLAGLYEVAIDEFCSDGEGRAKIIGSTATIRRAREQVRALFDRSVELFPPPGIEHDDSGFAVTDAGLPGRTYVGITTAGRSPKFTLQAVLASVLQAGESLKSTFTDGAIDPYWTCVTYFNSLRELGGAVVLVEDDVRRSLEARAAHRAERPRMVDTPAEITSRVPTNEIPDVLEKLANQYPKSEVDVVLASNMISVGVDVPRLGLMVVNGQPKTTAEYIQATSRVGRGATPGLVVVIYNAQRPRDRARYESFQTWHAALYRDVEPTSVTPFAPRARDRALHAPLVAMVRHLHPSKGRGPRLHSVDAAASVVERILDRVNRVDPTAVDAARSELEARVDDWSERVLSRWWWSRYKATERALMIGAEDAASLRVDADELDAWPTPNSMREVEPPTKFRFARRLAKHPRP